MPGSQLVTLTVIAVALAVAAGLARLVYLVVRDTRRRSGRWGINLDPAVCRKCREPAPAVRRPGSVRQALWGGWTCPKCGSELDKWGEPTAKQPSSAR
jgi:hypothetical protein